MATKRRNLFLYLTLACFFGLLAIFIIDGYLGIYDTITITAAEREQKIEPDVWLEQDRFWSTGIDRGEKALFSYEVDNRQFSSYEADIWVSVWRAQEKLLDVTSQSMMIGPFDKGQMEWVIDNNEIVPADIPPEQNFEYTVIIKRGEIERKVIVYINPVPYVPKPVPAR